MRSDRPSRTLSRLAAGGFAVTDIAVESLPVVSLAAGSVLSGPIGTIAGYGVFAAAFFTVADRIYRDVLPADIRGTGFDLLFTKVAVSIMLTQRFVARQTELSAVLIIGPVVVGAVLFAVYVHRVGSRSLTDPTAPLVKPYQQIMIWTDVRSEVVQDLDRDGWRRYGSIVGFSAATGLLLAVPAYIAGVIGLLLARAYPLPDLLAIAWVGGMVVPRQPVDQFTARIPNLRTRVELDTELLATSGEAVRGPFGLIALMFAVAGAFASASIIFTGITTGVVWADSFTTFGGILTTIRQQPLVLWNIFGAVGTAIGAGGVLLWAWVREFRRIPAYLDQREPTPDVSTVPVRQMTVALLVLPLQLPLTELFTGYLGEGTSPTTWLLAITWPLWLLAIGAIAYHGIRYGRIATNRERGIMLAGVLVVVTAQLTKASVAGAATSILPGQPAERLVQQAAASHPIRAIPIGALLCIVALLPEFWHVDSQRDDKMADIAYYAIAGSVCLLGSTLLPVGSLRISLLSLGTFSVGASVVIGGLDQWTG